MKIKVITLKFQDEAGFDGKEIDAFCDKFNVIDFKDHFFSLRGQPYLALLISYSEEKKDSNKMIGHKDEDPRKSLNKEDRILYERLREWRAMRSGAEGIPPYLIVNNIQLTEIAKNKPQTKQGLESIKGIGNAKIEKYGLDIFEIIKSTEIEKNKQS